MPCLAWAVLAAPSVSVCMCLCVCVCCQVRGACLVLCCCAACGPQINALNETLSCSECPLCLLTRPGWDRGEGFERVFVSPPVQSGASYYDWKAKGSAWSQRVKTWECLFWHNMQNWPFFLKTCGKRLQTDLSLRQVPALPSVFSFTSLSVCSQLIPSSLYTPDSSIHLSLSLCLFLPVSPIFHQSDQSDTLPIMHWHTPFTYLEEIKSGGKSNQREIY